MRFSEDAEQVCAGFWPGDERTPFPAFFAYGYPKPDDIENAQLRPAAARWVEAPGLFLLPYDAVRETPDAERAILDFLETTYAACADRLGWSSDLVSAAEPAVGTSS